MRKGREMLGLPVFSWHDNLLLGRVVDLYLDHDIRRLAGLILHRKGLRRAKPTIGAADILRIYDDGIVVRHRQALKKRFANGLAPIYYSEFLNEAELPRSEGEIIADLFFDDRNRVIGFEISRGLWRDLAGGRAFYPRKEEDKPWGVQKNGRE